MTTYIKVHIFHVQKAHIQALLLIHLLLFHFDIALYNNINKYLMTNKQTRAIS